MAFPEPTWPFALPLPEPAYHQHQPDLFGVSNQNQEEIFKNNFVLQVLQPEFILWGISYLRQAFLLFFYNFQFQEATDWLEVGLSLPEPTNLILCKKQQVNLRATGRPILSFEPD